MTIAEIIAGRSIKTVKYVACNHYEDALFISGMLQDAGAEDVVLNSPKSHVYEVYFTDSTN